MLTENAIEDSRFSFWPRVRRFAVPPSMIETATARRRAGDWAGACAAAGIDVDFRLNLAARAYGRALAAQVRADLRQLAPDLLRWHMPRIAPDGLLRPGLTMTLARYDTGGGGAVHLVARTPPAWAAGGQRISLALWDGTRPGGVGRHPHPHPDRRFRLDLHRHLWDARRSGELRIRSGADQPPEDGGWAREAVLDALWEASPDAITPHRGRRWDDAWANGLRTNGSWAAEGWAVDRWAAEAALLLRAEGRSAGAFAVRFGARRRLLLEPAWDADGGGPPRLRVAARPADGDTAALPVLPDAATWVLPDLALLRAGLTDADRLHPLVAAALLPDRRTAGRAAPPAPAEGSRLVECQGARHRIGLVDGVLVALDHDPAEIRREELLAALTGTPMPCLQAIDAAHRRPEALSDVRARLDHGDAAGALAVVESLIGPQARLRHGALRDELAAAAQRRVDHGMFRAGLSEPGTHRHPDRTHHNRRSPDQRAHPRHALRH